MVMDLMSGGHLLTKIQNISEIKLNEEIIAIIMKQLLSAVYYLHDKKICHKDIKPENVMFSDECDINSLKLIDFGTSISYAKYTQLIGICGTRNYQAPEIIQNKK